MKCSICRTETDEILLFKNKTLPVCYTCVETGRIRSSLRRKIVINRQTHCSFCGTETTELRKSPGFAICHSCLKSGKTEAGLGYGRRCSLCGQVIGTVKGIFGVFCKRPLQAARIGQDAVLCSECLELLKESPELEIDIKFHKWLMNALWNKMAR
jgi:ribosomal protein S14